MSDQSTPMQILALAAILTAVVVGLVLLFHTPRLPPPARNIGAAPETGRSSDGISDNGRPSALRSFPEGTLAMSMRVDDLTDETIRLVVPGARVDIIATRRKANGETESRIAATDVLVLAVDELLIIDLERKRPCVVTFVVTPEQAEELVDTRRARVSLVVRKPANKHVAPQGNEKKD